MPRPRKLDGREPKSRSRNGCWSCKARKVKCTEERPSCSKCIKGGYQCDYGIRLNWDGRRSKRPQLKAVHLDNGPLVGEDGGFNDFMGEGEGESEGASGLPEAPLHPPRSQSQHEMQFQLDLTLSPPSVPSSSAPTASPHGFNLISFHASSTPPMSSATPSKQSRSRQSGTAGQGQVVSAAAMTPSSPVFTKQIKSASKLSLGAPPTPSGASSAPRSSVDTQRTPLPGTVPYSSSSHPYVSGSIDESVSSAEAGDLNIISLKRQRIDSDVSENDFAWTWPLSPSTGSGSLSAPSPRQVIHPPSFMPNRPAGDASSPRPNDENPGRGSPHAIGNLSHPQTTHDHHRLSVSSLLSGPFGPNAVVSTPPENPTSTSQDDAKTDYGTQDHSRHHHGHNQYGIDAGFVDLDLHKNDDFNALSGTAGNYKQGNLSCYRHGKAYEPGCYYSKPVPVYIPRALGQLPSKLMDNPMNLLYFHHFINNTARVLVPHDDPQSNPFRTILPQLALNNDNLMSLLLAYSASHRARVLDQPEPVMRIALWVQDIFPALRESLTDPKQKISNANVATAIMLSSLAIVSPTAFGYAIPWQRHLMLARELIGARPEGLRVDHHSSLEGQVCSFLWSWFAYLDVLGGLSGGPNDVSPAWILDYKVYDPQDDDEIDCIMGFTTRCIYILSQIAELVRECEPSRLAVVKQDPGGWYPGPEIERRVESLEVDVRDSMVQKPRPCAHLKHKGDVTRWDAVEMEATNEAYHWAALVHLHRRVLGKLPDHPDVQGPVQKIIKCLDSVKVGGTAENCWLFPLFTAACECFDDAQRRKMLDRIRKVEGCGMMQVTRARVLMQKAWGTGKPWEVLLEGEFLG